MSLFHDFFLDAISCTPKEKETETLILCGNHLSDLNFLSDFKRLWNLDMTGNRV